VYGKWVLIVRVFALSDVHCDYQANFEWVRNLSAQDFRDDILILAGDISDSMHIIARSLEEFVRRFHRVLFVPGNHEMWTVRDDARFTSIEKFHAVRRFAEESGALTVPYHRHKLSIVPLFGWYDYSFGMPSDRLLDIWSDYRNCKWDQGFTDQMITDYLVGLNKPHMDIVNDEIITFSHFLPRIDIMPIHLPERYKMLYPVLGSSQIDGQVRHLGARLHVYGHSHLNRRVDESGVTYINNAFGYPYESNIASKSLLVIREEH
jgi:Icc-related predicted phosphoesterase